MQVIPREDQEANEHVTYAIKRSKISQETEAYHRLMLEILFGRRNLQGFGVA